MKLSKAIEIIEQQKQKVINPKHENNKLLIVETSSYLRYFFGSNSAEYNFIDSFDFTIDFGRKVTEQYRDIAFKKNADDFVLFLENCKTSLKNKGLPKEPNNNFLSSKSNSELIPILFAVIVVIFSLGYWAK